jgi:hypothetical protein
VESHVRDFVFDSVPNFILAFIPAQINRNTLNTMTAFAVRVCASASPGRPGACKRLIYAACLLRLVVCYPMFFFTSYHIRFSESTKMGLFIS